MEHLQGTLQGTGRVSGNLSLPSGRAIAPFTGEYTYTPSNEAQIIEIEGLRALSNITIDPIPDNYGLITWNGSTLTVS